MEARGLLGLDHTAHPEAHPTACTPGQQATPRHPGSLSLHLCLSSSLCSPRGQDTPSALALNVLSQQQLCLLFPGDTIWAPSVLPHGTLGTLSHYPQLHFGRKMESKVSEGGLNVTLTIRLLMHGKVQKHKPCLCHPPPKASHRLGGREGTPTLGPLFCIRF